MTTVLAVEGLRKSFGAVRAVDGVSFAVAAGELLAIIGPNGAGKSTCFNLVNGQLRPDAGRVALLGQDITGLPPSAIFRRAVGRTFQVAATFGSMTVAENVQMALLSWHRRLASLWPGASKLYLKEARTIFTQMNLHDLADHPCGERAYGDLKRVELAMAIAGQPRLLLMDEPTAGMAPGERAQIMRLVSEVARARDIAVLFTEHDMDVVFGHAHRVIVLDRGRIIAEGAPPQVRDDERVQEVYLGGPADQGGAGGC